MSLLGLVGLVGLGSQVALILDILLLLNLIKKFFPIENTVFDYPKEFDNPQESDSLKVISNECVDFDDPKEFMIPMYLMMTKDLKYGL